MITMKYTLSLLALIGAVAAQGVTEDIAPDGSYPEGCSKSYDGQLEVTVVTIEKAKKRSLLPQHRAECGADGILVMSLQNGVLKDAKDRTGYIAANYQFQFDAPAQTGAIYTAGFSICGNGSLALGGSTTFYQCKSGSFWNLYDRSWAEQCSPISMLAMPCGGADPPGYASQGGDGQVVATAMVTTTIVKPISDGQPQVLTTEMPVPMCQIGDGQVQAHTTPCASITAASTPASSSPPPPPATPVSQLSDGQIQVPPSAPPAPTETESAPPPPPTSPLSESAPAPNTTLATTLHSSSSASGTSTPTPVPANDAGRIQVGSVAALIIGIMGAIAFL